MALLASDIVQNLVALNLVALVEVLATITHL